MDNMEKVLQSKFAQTIFFTYDGVKPGKKRKQKYTGDEIFLVKLKNLLDEQAKLGSTKNKKNNNLTNVYNKRK